MKPYTLLSCIESKMIHPTKLYARFELGQFATGQAVTVANTLRRALLSQLPGVAITLIHIPNVSHEYESIHGVQEPVLDIISNLKKIVFTSEFEAFQPQIGFLHLKGPAVIRAGDLKLPFFISCVNPEQYITTVTEHGDFRLTVLINSGKQYLNHTPDSPGFPDRVAILKQHQQSITQPTLFGKPQRRFYLNWRQQRQMAESERLTHIARFVHSKLAQKLWKQKNNRRQQLVKKARDLLLKTSRLPSDKPNTQKKSATSSNRSWAPYWHEGEEKRRLENTTFLAYQLLDLDKKKKKDIEWIHRIRHEIFGTTGYLPVNAFFSPVTKVNYTIQIEENRLGENACFEVWTNGSIDPRRAIHRSVTALIKLFLPFQLVQHENQQLRPIHPKIKQRRNRQIRKTAFQNLIDQPQIQNLMSLKEKQQPVESKTVYSFLQELKKKPILKRKTRRPKNRFPTQWPHHPQRRRKAIFTYIQPIESGSPCNRLGLKRHLFRPFRMVFPLFNIVDRFCAHYGLNSYECNKLGQLNILNLELPLKIYKFLWQHQVQNIEDLFSIHSNLINQLIPNNKKLTFYRAFHKAFAKLFYQWTGTTQQEAKILTKQRFNKLNQKLKRMEEEAKAREQRKMLPKTRKQAKQEREDKRMADEIWAKAKPKYLEDE
jgi:DNA-directed RNA polymerase alpha subunit